MLFWVLFLSFLNNERYTSMKNPENHGNILNICLYVQITKQTLNNYQPSKRPKISIFEGYGLILAAS